MPAKAAAEDGGVPGDRKVQVDADRKHRRPADPSVRREARCDGLSVSRGEFRYHSGPGTSSHP